MHTLTDEQLRYFSSQHLRYEVEMLLGLRNVLVRSVPHATSEDKITFSACLEAWGIHLRLLTNFLYGSRDGDTDAIAADFMADVAAWKLARPTKDPELDRATTTRAGKEIAHLSYLRRERVPWDVKGLTEKVMAALVVFVEHAEPAEKLDPFFIEVLRALASTPVDMSRLPPDAGVEDLLRLSTETSKLLGEGTTCRTDISTP